MASERAGETRTGGHGRARPGARIRAWIAAVAAIVSVPCAAVEGVAHRVESSAGSLHVWEKCAVPCADRPVVVLAHGSGSSGRESFDLQVKDTAGVSLMDVLADAGYDVFAPDVRGFGRSARPAEGVTTAQAAEDLHTVVEHVRRLRGVGRVAVVAWSWGTQYAGLFVAAHPDSVARFVSYAQMHADSPDLVRRRAGIDAFRASPYRTIAPGAWTGRFHSQTPDGCTDPAVQAAFAQAAAQAEPQTPNGPQVDMATRMPMVDPRQLAVPVLIIHGQFDDVADVPGLIPFFSLLPHPEKRYVVVPDGGHMLHLQQGRFVFHRALLDFLR